MSALISFLASSHFKVRRGSKVFCGCAKEQIVVGKKVFLIRYAELLSFCRTGLTHFPYNMNGEGSYHPNNKLLPGASEYSRVQRVKSNFGLCLFTLPSHLQNVAWLCWKVSLQDAWRRLTSPRCDDLVCLDSKTGVRKVVTL